jgi:GntR family transcriptional regulator
MRGRKNRSDYIFDANIPLHHHIYSQMRRDILDGIWLGRDDFPGEEELAATFGVSTITSRAALDRLVQEGLVSRQRGRRPAVTYDPAAYENDTPSPAVFPVAVEPFEYDVIARGVTSVPAVSCLALGKEPGTRLWQCARLRRFLGAIHSVSFNVQEPELGDRHHAADLDTLPMEQILAKAGRPIQWLAREITVGIPNTVAATALKISLIQPVLVHTYVVSDAERKPIEWVRIFLHPSQDPPKEEMNLIDRSWDTLSVI